MQPAIFLDRDNTLIFADGDIARPEQVKLRDGIVPALKRLHEAGFQLVVVTNQSGVARGSFSEDDVIAVNQRIASLVHQQAGGEPLIERFYYCPYDPTGTVDEYRRDHSWRKPQPGMILQAAHDLNIELSRSWMIGVTEHDVFAGRAAGCRTILVSDDAAAGDRCHPSFQVHQLDQATRLVLEHSERAAAPLNGFHAAGSGVPGFRRGSRSTPEHSTTPTTDVGADELAQLRRSMNELVEEIRSDRMRKADFSIGRLLAGVAQLLAILLAMLGLMQVGSTDVFVKWMLGAAMAQLVTITLLVGNSRG